MQMTSPKLIVALGDMLATAAVLDPAATWVGFYTARTGSGPGEVLASLTLPDATKYPAKAITTWGAIYLLTDGSPVADAAVKSWAPPDNVSPTVVTGWYLTDALVAGNLIAYQDLPTPKALNVTTDHWSLVVRPMLDQSGRWDMSLSWNG